MIDWLSKITGGGWVCPGRDRRAGYNNSDCNYDILTTLGPGSDELRVLEKMSFKPINFSGDSLGVFTK